MKHSSVARSIIDMERIINCPFSLSIDKAEMIFKDLEQSGVRVSIRKIIIPLPKFLRQSLTVRSNRRLDEKESGRQHDQVVFDWTTRSPLFPDFYGVISFRIHSERTLILFHGEYIPPFGVFGQIFDAILGRHIAVGTMEEVCDRLQALLENEFKILKHI